MDVENRRNIVESSFQAAAAVGLNATLKQQFEIVRNTCDDATAAYLSAIGSDSDPTSGNTNSYDPMATVQRAQQLLDSAGHGLDQFYNRNRATLEAAAARGAAASAEADTAVKEADDVTRRLKQTEDALRAYPSVQRVTDELAVAYYDLEVAREQRDIAMIGDRSRKLKEAARSVVETLDAAPKQGDKARNTLASLRTRLDALRNRIDSVDTNRSALLREFNSNSSLDLINNGTAGRDHLTRADSLLAQAVAAQRERGPEAALELAAQSRAELTSAEQLIDAVADRLAMLRELRKDPASKERDVRFRLRDAQRLAVDRGVVNEWGKALDAQAARIDAIVQGLRGPHPDFWGYHRELTDVSTYIGTIVSRIRQRSAR